jgi:hypothetical protein
MQQQEKRAFGGYWLAPSLSRVQMKDNDMIVFVGVHKPRGRGTRDMDEIKRDPDAYLPKMDISIYTLYGPESFPTYARDIPRIVGAISILNPTPVTNGAQFGNRVMALINSWKNRPDLPVVPYIEFNPNEMVFKDVAKLAEKYGHPAVTYDLVDPMKRQRDILWLKKSLVVMKRPLRDKRNAFIKDMLFIGKDIKRNEVVLGLKKESKTWKYNRIVPLYANGLYFSAAVRFMAEEKPARSPLISDVTFDRFVQEAMQTMRDVDLVSADITMDAKDLIDLLG